MDNDCWYNDGTGYRVYKIDEINFTSIKSRINFFTQQQRQRDNENYYHSNNNLFRRQTFNEPSRINYQNINPPETVLITKVINNIDYDSNKYRPTNGNHHYHDEYDEVDEGDDFEAMEKNYLKRHSLKNKQNLSSSTNSTSQSKRSSDIIEQNNVNVRNSKKVSQILRKFSTDLKNSREHMLSSTVPQNRHQSSSSTSSQLASTMSPVALSSPYATQTSTAAKRNKTQRTVSISDEQAESSKITSKLNRNSSIDISNNISLRPSLTNLNDDLIASFQTPSNRYLTKSQINNRSSSNNNNKSIEIQDNENNNNNSNVRLRNKDNLNKFRKNVVSSTATITVPINSLPKTSSLSSIALKCEKDDPSTINVVFKFEPPIETSSQLKTNSKSELTLNNYSTTVPSIETTTTTTPAMLSTSLIVLPSQKTNEKLHRPSKLIESLNKINYDENENENSLNDDETKISLRDETVNHNEDKNNNDMIKKEQNDDFNPSSLTTYESEDTLINNLFQPILSAFDDYNNESTDIDVNQNKNNKDYDKEDSQVVFLSSNNKLDKTYSASTHSLMSTLLIDKIHNYSTDGSIRTHSSLINVNKNNNNIVNNNGNDFTDNDAVSSFSSNNNLNDSVIVDSKKEILKQSSSHVAADGINKAKIENEEDHEICEIHEVNKIEISSSKKSRKYSLLLDKILLNDKFQNNNINDRYYVPSENSNPSLNSRKVENGLKLDNYISSNKQNDERRYKKDEPLKLDIPDISTQLSEPYVNNPSRRSKRSSKNSSKSGNVSDKYRADSYRFENVAKTYSDNNYLNESRLSSYNITDSKSDKQNDNNKKGKKLKFIKENTGAILNLKRFGKKDKVVKEETDNENEKELKPSEPHKIRNQLKKNCKIS